MLKIVGNVFLEREKQSSVPRRKDDMREFALKFAGCAGEPCVMRTAERPCLLEKAIGFERIFSF